MDLLLIARKIWRYKFATLPILALIVCGAVMVVAVKEPVYQASSTYILINPPAPPTAEDIARDPTLGRANADNPYTRFPDQSVVVQILASTLGSESARRELVAAGADPRYTVAPTSEFGYSTPIVEIVGVGPTPEVAVGTAKLVGRAAIRQLDRMQQAEGVDRPYRITTQQVDSPDSAQLQASGQLRALVGVLGLGAVLLFVVVSVADALTKLRTERTRRLGGSRLTANDEPWSTGGSPPDGLSGLGENDWMSGGPLDGPAPSNGDGVAHLPLRQERRRSNL
jgi:hypothetical protein